MKLHQTMKKNKKKVHRWFIRSSRRNRQIKILNPSILITLFVSLMVVYCLALESSGAVFAIFMCQFIKTKTKNNVVTNSCQWNRFKIVANIFVFRFLNPNCLRKKKKKIGEFLVMTWPWNKRCEHRRFSFVIARYVHFLNRNRRKKKKMKKTVDMRIIVLFCSI